MDNYPSIEILKANPMMAIMTGHTCGEACWHAREDVCRCSCGGSNHGILKSGAGVQPDRTARIGGSMYRLIEIGSYIDIEKSRMAKTRECCYHWLFDPHGPFIRKPASASQIKNWPEVRAYPFAHPNLLWQAV